ncbi:MAG: LysM peptidoglycan-binding domain-containing protein [Kordiimonadaceae bacterium]|nr:LysM peptidoglycan-binding domain-containing protein [Kordiimonadaceae bacterium]
MRLLESESDDKRQGLMIGAGAVILVVALAYVFWADSNTSPVQNANSPTQSDTATKQAKTTDISIPAFDLVRISRGGTGVIAGRMAPGAHVELHANNKKIAEVVADNNGEWVMILEEPLEAGSVELNLKATENGRSQIAEAANVVVVSVPKRESDRFLERQQNGVVAVLAPKNGVGGSRVLQKPGVAAFAEVGESLSLDVIDYGQGGNPVFSGRSLPRVEVRLYLDDKFISTTRADDTGRWIVEYPVEVLSSGEHVIRLDQTIGEGKVQLRIEQPFITGVPIDLAAATGGVIVQPGNTLWQIARQLYGSGVRYTLIFRENNEQIRDPDLIYPGQIFSLPIKSNTG